MLTLDGETLTIKDWARKLGCPDATIHQRLKAGWDLRTSLTKPPDYAFRYLGKFTKSEAEIHLNETTRDKFPKELVEFITKRRGKKIGSLVRKYHRKAFDQWFIHYYLGAKRATLQPPVPEVP